MTEEIKAGIAKQLRTIYTEEEAAIYTEKVEQGLKRPCFFLLLEKEEYKPLLGRRYRRTLTFDICYIGQEDGETGLNNQNSQVRQIVVEALQFFSLEDGSLIHPIRWETNTDKGGYLHCKPTFILFGYHDGEEAPYMEKFVLKEEID